MVILLHHCDVFLDLHQHQFQQNDHAEIIILDHHCQLLQDLEIDLEHHHQFLQDLEIDPERHHQSLHDLEIDPERHHQSLHDLEIDLEHHHQFLQDLELIDLGPHVCVTVREKEKDCQIYDQEVEKGKTGTEKIEIEFVIVSIVTVIGLKELLIVDDPVHRVAGNENENFMTVIVDVLVQEVVKLENQQVLLHHQDHHNHCSLFL